MLVCVILCVLNVLLFDELIVLFDEVIECVIVECLW